MKIIHKRENCIGCGMCTNLCEKYWQMAEDGKAKLLNSKEKNGNWELEIKELDCNQEVADSCPVQCIQIIK
jgi:ferredoxin